MLLKCLHVVFYNFYYYEKNERSNEIWWFIQINGKNYFCCFKVRHELFPLNKIVSVIHLIEQQFWELIISHFAYLIWCYRSISDNHHTHDWYENKKKSNKRLWFLDQNIFTLINTHIFIRDRFVCILKLFYYFHTFIL